MRLNAPARDGITKREFLGAATIGAAFGLAAMVGHQPGTKPAMINEPKRALSGEEIIARHKAQMEKVKKMGIQQYINQARRQGHQILKKGDPRKSLHQCIDERYGNGQGVHCIAGLGVHQANKVRSAIAEGMIRNAEKKRDELRKLGIRGPVIIELEWHGKRTQGKPCGAALVSLINKSREKGKEHEHFEEEQIDQEAENGAFLLKAEIELQLMKRPDRRDFIVMVQGDTPDFANIDYHPSELVIVNGSDQEYNRENGTGLMSFETDFDEVGEVAIDDAFLANDIIHGNHGAFHHAQQSKGERHEEHREQAEGAFFAFVGTPQVIRQMRHLFETKANALPPARRQKLANSRKEDCVVA